MIDFETVFIIVLFILTVGSLGIWLHLFLILKKSFKFSPRLLKPNGVDTKKGSFVSIIIPARNEEKLIKKCLSSLVNQTHSNYEIIVIDDDSTDKTIEKIQSLTNDDKIRIIKAGKKPKGWVGKNWPCYIGYKYSKGNYLLFTDADTIHSPNSVLDSLYTLLEEQLDVLTVVPNLIYPTFIVKMVLPILSIFMFSKYSPMRVNDPKIKLGYLFGSFFIMSKTMYEKIGTHESVKSEIVEDGALGKKIKECGFQLKMFRGEDILSAYWARDFHTLWNSLKRLIIPMYFTNKINSILLTIGIFILMVFPFVVLGYTFVNMLINNGIDFFLIVLLFVFSSLNVSLIYLTNFYQLQKAKTHKVKYFLGTPLGCLMVSVSFIWSIISSEKKGVIKWRNRVYHYNG
ncbi:MAG: glycosyltransferase [Nitrosopumilus sp.]|nr:glycosyltransferase [Nitrosopumilus sp.]